MVGSFGRINLHLADLCTGAAVGTLAIVYPVFEHGNRVKNRIDSSQRTEVFAERAINQDGQKNSNCQQNIFPSIQPSNGASHGLVQQDKRESALQCARRADQFTEIGSALSYDVYQI